MPDDQPIPDEALYFQLFNEIGIINQLSRTRLEAQLPADVTSLMFSVVNHLVRLGDGRTPQSIAIAFEVPKTTMTHALACLESKGFVEMRPNPKDGRSKLVFLMPAGQAFRDGTIGALGADMLPLIDGFSREKVEAMLPSLAELRAILDKARDP